MSKHNVLSMSDLQKCWEYLRQHATRLMSLRPADVELAQEMSQSLGFRVSPNNVASMRRRHEVRAYVTAGDGSINQVLVTWKPRYQTRAYRFAKSCPEKPLSTTEQLRQLAERVAKLEADVYGS